MSTVRAFYIPGTQHADGCVGSEHVRMLNTQTSYTVPCTMPVRTPASPSDMSGLPAAPSAPRLLPALDPLVDGGIASFMLPTPLLPEFSSPHFSPSLLPTTVSAQSCFLEEPLSRGSLLRGTSTAASRDLAVILGPARRCAGSLHQPTDGCW